LSIQLQFIDYENINIKKTSYEYNFLRSQIATLEIGQEIGRGKHSNICHLQLQNNE